MTWQDVRQHYPHQWLLVEAVQAHTLENQRIIDQLSVLERFEDSRTAIQAYVAWHRQTPQREFYVLHTDRECLNIRERVWHGIRG